MDDRTVMLRYSKDGGYNPSNTKERSLGEIGEYMKKVSFTRLGEFTHCTITVSVASPIKRDLLTANANLIGRT